MCSKDGKMTEKMNFKEFLEEINLADRYYRLIFILPSLSTITLSLAKSALFAEKIDGLKLMKDKTNSRRNH